MLSCEGCWSSIYHILLDFCNTSNSMGKKFPHISIYGNYIVAMFCACHNSAVEFSYAWYCNDHEDVNILFWCVCNNPSAMYVSLLGPALGTPDITCCYGIPLYHVYTLTRIFRRGVSGCVTGCRCGVWCRGLTTRAIYVGPFLANRSLLSWFISAIEWRIWIIFLCYVKHISSLTH